MDDAIKSGEKKNGAGCGRLRPRKSGEENEAGCARPMPPCAGVRAAASGEEEEMGDLATGD
jgi:hypothetical protein